MSETSGRRPRPSPVPRPTPAPVPPEPAATPPEPAATPPEPAATPPEPALEPGRSRAARRQAERVAGRQVRRRRLRGVMIGALVVAVAAGAASIVIAVSSGDPSHRPSSSSAVASVPPGTGARLADPDLATAFIAGATSDITAVTSYDYRRLDDALAAGLSVTTGAYRSAFQAALTGQLAQTAKANHVVHDFQVLDAGVGTISADGQQAKVLIFGRQTVTDRSTPSGQAVLLTLCATIRRQGARYLISDLQENGDPGLPLGSSELTAAAEAGRAEVVNVLTYTRAHFDADLRRALAGAAAPLQGELERQAGATRSAMTKGGYDLAGVVTAVAVKTVAPKAVALLVAAESSRLSGTGAASQVSPVRYEVMVTLAEGGWRASQISTLTSP